MYETNNVNKNKCKENSGHVPVRVYGSLQAVIQQQQSDSKYFWIVHLQIVYKVLVTDGSISLRA